MEEGEEVEEEEEEWVLASFTPLNGKGSFLLPLLLQGESLPLLTPPLFANLASVALILVMVLLPLLSPLFCHSSLHILSRSSVL